MLPFLSNFVRRSEKNGDIRFFKQLFTWNLEAQGMDQSSDYLTRMWRHALARIPRKGVKSVLVLGLGAGSCVRPLRRRFRGAAVTAVEWDSAMVEIADRLRMFRPKDRPKILVGDVREVLPRMEETFDVILCDLFDGPRVSDALRDADVISTLRNLLSRDGWLLFNAFREPELFEGFGRIFSGQKTWKTKWNWLALYRHFGRGTVGDPLPNGYRPARMIEEYVARESLPGTFYRRVGQPGCPGMRWHHGPLWFEGYMGDTEPRIDEDAPSRLITWQPVTRMTPPPGWWHAWLPANPQLTGFVDIVDPERYWEPWSSHMKRHRTKWLKTQPFTIEDVAPDEFAASYGHRRMASWLVRLTIQLLQNKVKRHGDRVHFFGARDPQTNKLVAGFAVVDVPEGKQSIHLASFITGPAKRTSVGVGMVDAWFRRSIARGIRFLDFDLFWTLGSPREWKGFSRFKSQFGVTFVRYPRPFLRVVRQKKKMS